MSLIESFFTNTYEVERRQDGYYKDGFWREGGVEILQIRGSLQPMTGRKIKIEAMEGERLSQMYEFYTDQRVVARTPGKLKRPDSVKINGESYKVIEVEEWVGQRVDLPHYKTTLVRESFK